MGENFVTIEEMKKNLEESKYAVMFFGLLVEALKKGDFVLYDPIKNNYRIAEKDKPIIILPKKG